MAQAAVGCWVEHGHPTNAHTICTRMPRVLCQESTCALDTTVKKRLVLILKRNVKNLGTRDARIIKQVCQHWQDDKRLIQYEANYWNKFLVDCVKTQSRYAKNTPTGRSHRRPAKIRRICNSRCAMAAVAICSVETFRLFHQVVLQSQISLCDYCLKISR
jgi:hypothetical protein